MSILPLYEAYAIAVSPLSVFLLMNIFKASARNFGSFILSVIISTIEKTR